MRKLPFHIVLVCFVVFLLVAFSGPDEEANKLFVEAYQLIKSGEEAEKTSYADAFKLYKDALAKLQKIVSDYPSSRLAVEIIQGKAKIGSYKVRDFEATIVPMAKIRAEAEESAFACTLLASRMIKDGKDRVLALAKMAVKYGKVGEVDKSSQVLSEALQVAQTMEGITYITKAQIAIKYAEAGQYDQALQVAEMIVGIETRAGVRTGAHAYALSAIAIEFVKAEQYDRALHLVEMLEPDLLLNNEGVLNQITKQ